MTCDLKSQDYEKKRLKQPDMINLRGKAAL